MNVQPRIVFDSEMPKDKRCKEDARRAKSDAFDLDAAKKIADYRNRKNNKQRIGEGINEDASKITGLLFCSAPLSGTAPAFSVVASASDSTPSSSAVAAASGAASVVTASTCSAAV